MTAIHGVVLFLTQVLFGGKGNDVNVPENDVKRVRIWEIQQLERGTDRWKKTIKLELHF